MKPTQMQKDLSNWLIVSDIDGTLLDSKTGEIAPRNIEAINRFISLGGKFSLATGRASVVIKGILDRVPVSCPLVVCNGSMIYDPTVDRVVYYREMSDEAKRFAIEMADFRTSIGLAVYNENDMLVIKRTPNIGWLVDYESAAPVEMEPDEAVKHIWCKAVLVGDVEDISALGAHYERLGSGHCGTRGVASMELIFELLPSGASKASALKRLGEMLGVPHEHVCAIGDYYNDAEMIAYAGVGGAVATAPDEIKATADIITGTAADGGVADFIDRIIELA